MPIFCARHYWAEIRARNFPANAGATDWRDVGRLACSPAGTAFGLSFNLPPALCRLEAAP
jgi:hypothetical protein